jgi:hypothetical protein
MSNFFVMLMPSVFFSPPLNNVPGLVVVNPLPTLTVSTVPAKKITYAEKDA